jgi:hypothetical protein
MGILHTNKISGLGTDGTVFQGVTRFDTQGYFVAPSGTTDQRNAGITTTDGTIRFNTDSQKLEFYAQSQWWEMVIDTPALGVAANTDAGARGVFGGKETPGNIFSNDIEYLNISSAGNTLTFGDLTGVRRFNGSLASSTRGIWAGGTNPGSAPGLQTAIDFVTISSTGNAASFGSLSSGRRGIGGLSNATRGIFAGGLTPSLLNTIEYITIATTGNPVDFGDLTQAREFASGCASPTRGVIAGGAAPGSVNTIDFITISTLGNAFDFGDLVTAVSNQSSLGSNPIRGIYGGATTNTNKMNYITIATTGNASNFGDLSVTRGGAGVCSSSTRCVFVGGFTSSATVNTIDYVNFATFGNATDFGDVSGNPGQDMAGCSNAHGGL